jgi:hypothetical protein
LVSHLSTSITTLSVPLVPASMASQRAWARRREGAHPQRSPAKSFVRRWQVEETLNLTHRSAMLWKLSKLVSDAIMTYTSWRLLAPGSQRAWARRREGAHPQRSPAKSFVRRWQVEEAKGAPTLNLTHRSAMLWKLSKLVSDAIMTYTSWRLLERTRDQKSEQRRSHKPCGC